MVFGGNADLYFRIQRNWELRVKMIHQIHLDVREGFWRDKILLYVDDELLVHDTVSIRHIKDYALFDIDGRTHELRWIWSFFAGFPLSIVLMYKGQILAKYGDERAAKDDFLNQEG